MADSPAWRAVRWALIALVSGGLASTILTLLAFRFYLSITRPYETTAVLALSFAVCFWIIRRPQWRAERLESLALLVLLLASFTAGFWGQFYLLMAIRP